MVALLNFSSLAWFCRVKIYIYTSFLLDMVNFFLGECFCLIFCSTGLVGIYGRTLFRLSSWAEFSSGVLFMTDWMERILPLLSFFITFLMIFS